jgi:hypothetical protein
MIANAQKTNLHCKFKEVEVIMVRLLDSHLRTISYCRGTRNYLPPKIKINLSCRQIIAFSRGRLPNLKKMTN